MGHCHGKGLLLQWQAWWDSWWQHSFLVMCFGLGYSGCMLLILLPVMSLQCQVSLPSLLSLMMPLFLHLGILLYGPLPPSVSIPHCLPEQLVIPFCNFCHMLMEVLMSRGIDLLHREFLFQSAVDLCQICLLQHRSGMVPPNIGQDSFQPDGFALQQHLVDVMEYKEHHR